MLWLIVASWAALMDEINMKKVKPHLLKDETSTQLVFSECEGGDIFECATYALACHKDDELIYIDIRSKRTAEIASWLLREPDGDPEVTFTLAQGYVRARALLEAVRFTNGHDEPFWSLSLPISNSYMLLGLINEVTSNEASLHLAGVDYPLAPTGEASLLVEFRKSCQNISEFLRP